MDYDLLDNNFIIDNLTYILNGRPIIYKFIVSKIEKVKDAYVVSSDIKVDNYDNECLFINFKMSEKGVSIYVGILTKCVPIRDFGKYFLECLKEFATKFGYYSVRIEHDASKLYYTDFKNNKNKYIDINLSYLNILISGESWYNKMGFYHPKNIEEINNNKYIINKDISDIDNYKNITTFINLNIEREIIKNYEKFEELFDFILNITNKTPDNSIKEVFKSLYDYLRTNCNNIERSCDVDYLIIYKISIFINFVFKIAGLKYTNKNLEYITNEENTNQKSGNKKHKNKSNKLNKKLKNKHKKNKTKKIKRKLKTI